MDVRSKISIREHLQKEDVQERILQYIQKGRDEATVTISRAADLFRITENKLRDWEEYGFLNPLRPGGPKGRRLYTPAELDKLAIIRELIDAGYAASDIPADIDKLWHLSRPLRDSNDQDAAASPGKANDLTINQRIIEGRSRLFWRYYITQATRLSLMLICEDLPHTTAGLLLPLQTEIDSTQIQQIEDLPRLGETLVSWLSQSRSSHTLFTSKPSFQYSSDFRIEHLRTIKAGIPLEDNAIDQTLIVIQREARPLNLTASIVETIHRLLAPIYADRKYLRDCFGWGFHDMLWPATDLVDGAGNYEDVILNGLCDTIIYLGGKTEEQQPRWDFCNIFISNYQSSMLSVQQRSLIVCAQSEQAPTTIGVTTHIPQEPFISSCIKAFQSGHSIYLPDMKDSNQAQQPGENRQRSSIAIPIETDDGTSIGVLHVSSSHIRAFDESDLCVLRVIGRMIRETLETYLIRQKTASKLRDMLTNPGVVDTHFQEFRAEDNFITNVEQILSEVQEREHFQTNEVISFIAIDIDNQSSIAHKYGDRLARDLSRAVGLRIHSQLRAFKDATEYNLYHIGADRYYIQLNQTTLEQARNKAELLKQTLEGTYSIDPRWLSTGQPTSTENMVTITNTTVRLGVSSYPYQKLKEILSRYTAEHSITEVRMLITGFLEEELAFGRQKGGNIVISWDPTTQNFVRTRTPH